MDFAFLLAKEVHGTVDVAGMLDIITEREFRYWQAWFKGHPFGDERNDLRTALGFSAMCNTLGGKTEVQQFMPFTNFDEQEVNTQLEIQKAKSIAIKMGAVKEI